MSELHPKLAKAKAQTALLFLSAFDGEDFGVMREDSPGPYDRRHLAIALDHIQELGAMVLNLADRARFSTLREQNAAWWALVMGGGGGAGRGGALLERHRRQESGRRRSQALPH